MATAFISYTHADEALKDMFLQHLAPLRREGLIDVWHDRMLNVGDHLDKRIEEELAASDLIILLISAAFLTSEYCFEKEMQRAFARRRQGTASVVTLILRPCQWKNVPVGSGETLSQFLAVPRDGKPVTAWSNFDEALDDSAASIRGLLVKKKKQSNVEPAPLEGAFFPSSESSSVPTKRPSRVTLGIPTDRDRDIFLKEALELTGAVFQRELDTLSNEDSRVEYNFDSIDSQSFIATVYFDGKDSGSCRIFIGTEFMGRSLCLSFDSRSKNSMNEWLAIESVEGSLTFRGNGITSIRAASAGMDQQSAAEHLWGMFLSHVKARVR